jgi:hypothetical protein
MSEERETVSWEEMTYSNYLSLEAFANLLIRKEILTKEEIIEEITLIKHKHHSKPSGGVMVGKHFI